MPHPAAIALALAFALAAGPGHAGSHLTVAEARLAYVSGDYATALAVLLPAAEAGDPVAQNVIGAAYNSGHGVAQDSLQAVEWYERAAAQDFDKALVNLAKIYRSGRPGIDRDPARAIAYLDRAVALGLAEAMNLRGVMHENGEGGEADLTAAAALYRQAADLGDTHAINNLGNAHVFERGVEEDLAEALRLFRITAGQGDPGGLSNLGAMYENGYAVGQDSLAALAFYRLAAERGGARGALTLAYRLIEGANDAFRDPAEGWAWCLAALQRADADADFQADCDYLGGLISETDEAAGKAMLTAIMSR